MLGRIIQTLCILLTAVLAFLQGKPDVHLQVHGITNRSVDLILQINRTGHIQEIYWTLQSRILAVFQNNLLDIKNKDYDNRLEILDYGSILRINNLRKEDGGIYHVTVQYTDRNQDSASYILTVYDPVPPPSIQIGWEEDTGERCNVTLHCSVPSQTSHLSYTWKSRHQDSTYQLYSNGSSIQISLPPDHQDMELLCIVQNPADQKNVSINTQRDCSHPDTFRGSKESKEMQEIHYADLALETKSCERRAGPKNEEHNKETVYSAVVS
ncbi:CD48 antigen-like isoform X2 [Phyllobates terribilis]|uniref:CD48 antigen-like isoform X2 n=1 Tax=Phyllobates terribilis TaxID=111132 RepID=UPI003CCAA453